MFGIFEELACFANDGVYSVYYTPIWCNVDVCSMQHMYVYIVQCRMMYAAYFTLEWTCQDD